MPPPSFSPAHATRRFFPRAAAVRPCTRASTECSNTIADAEAQFEEYWKSAKIGQTYSIMAGLGRRRDDSATAKNTKPMTCQCAATARRFGADSASQRHNTATPAPRRSPRQLPSARTATRTHAQQAASQADVRLMLESKMVTWKPQACRVTIITSRQNITLIGY